MSAANPVPQNAIPARFIPAPAGGFVDTAALYLGADGTTVELLEWSKDLGRANFVDAQAVCAGAGEGFRAPTPHELVGIVNYDKEMPATDAPGVESDWYWTNQVDPSSPSDSAVYVYLRIGGVLWSSQSSSGRVRAVRRVRASQYLTLGV